ncbi:kinesin-like protein KIFC1 isoform X2 [Myiozetetes cayanensis]|uniref:kinesin-like protein KIFC1 isoform X2 n=1 Tax=Myiozetetes cayanensis TaxID=478635 RepID=UPI00215F64DA|nr:kinesin-like protein KIFC1 isoform X2 [Myiozetetes cayanensis]
MAAAREVGSGALPALSRLPVPRARDKRPPSGPGAEGTAAGPPRQKRARPGPGGERVPPRAPLRAVAAGKNGHPKKAATVVAAPRAGLPWKASTVAAAPRAGAPCGPPAPQKRPPWDLRGQVGDLREELGKARERLRELESHKQHLECGNQQLQERLAQLQRELMERERRESDLIATVGSLEVQLERSRSLAEGLALEKRRLEEEEQQRRRERDEGRAREQALSENLENTKAHMAQIQEQLQMKLDQMAALQEVERSQKSLLDQQEERIHLLEMERRRLHNDIQELKGNIRVFCRVRPVLPEESERQRGLQHLRFSPQDPKALVLTRPDEVSRVHPKMALKNPFLPLSKMAPSINVFSPQKCFFPSKIPFLSLKMSFPPHKFHFFPSKIPFFLPQKFCSFPSKTPFFFSKIPFFFSKIPFFFSKIPFFSPQKSCFFPSKTSFFPSKRPFCEAKKAFLGGQKCPFLPLLPLQLPFFLKNIHFPPPKFPFFSPQSHVGRERRPELRYDFTFDRVFPPGASQQEIFQEIQLLVQSALDGYPVCIFAYGQTGSGKTFTMEGPEPPGAPESRGMIPRAVQHLFQSTHDLAGKGWQYHFSASFLEIYNESLRDLLLVKGQRAADLDIRRVSPNSDELHVPNLTWVPVETEEEVLELLQRAGSQRSVAQTGLNNRSSRSHSVFQLRIRGEQRARDLRCASTLTLVDLAGSERLEKSGSVGDRLRETQSINSSLSALGLVITALCNKEQHVPYRNSKLTFLLQNCLGGNAKVLMFVTISPLEENFGESLNSLRFASKVNECMIGTAQANRK